MRKFLMLVIRDQLPEHLVHCLKDSNRRPGSHDHWRRRFRGGLATRSNGDSHETATLREQGIGIPATRIASVSVRVEDKRLCQVARSGIYGGRRGNYHHFGPAGKSSDGRENALARPESTGRATQRGRARSGDYDVGDRASSSAIGFLGNNRVGGRDRRLRRTAEIHQQAVIADRCRTARVRGLDVIALTRRHAEGQADRCPEGVGCRGLSK